jgi:hypothetical protein
MNSFLENREQYSKKGLYESLLMRSWKNQELKKIDKSVTCYGVLQGALDGTSLTIKCPEKALEAVRGYLRSGLERLSKSSLTVQRKKQLQELIPVIGQMSEIDDVDRLVERALEASQEQVKR